MTNETRRGDSTAASRTPRRIFLISIIPDSANSEFFINLRDNLFLNRTSDAARGYAVFGTVTEGADVVTAMTTAPCTPAPLISSECLPIPNLVITSATQTR